MTLDIIIYPIIAIIAACYGIPRIKGIWILSAILYVAGGVMAFLAAHVIFYYLVADTHYVFIPGIIGFFVWTILFFRLVLQNIGWSRQNQPISHP